MQTILKFCTWNLCLGLANKKDMVTETLNRKNVSVCCLQETEITTGFPENVLNCGGYNIELESNDSKKRAGIYIRRDVRYKRRHDLEEPNYHIVIIDVMCNVNMRIINLYRSFRPQGMVSPDTFFSNQLRIIKNALSNNCYIMGDFNLDAKMEFRSDYHHRIPLSSLTNFALEANLTQVVNFNTWSRIIKDKKKESLIDHVYVSNIATIKNVSFSTPTFGDHLLVMIDIEMKVNSPNYTVLKRDWSKYSPTCINDSIARHLSQSLVNWNSLTVTEHWNALELLLTRSIDEISPLKPVKLNFVYKGSKISNSITQKINKRKRLLKSDKKSNSTSNAPTIKLLNRDIRDYFHGIKLGRVKQAAMGPKVNLWKAVKLAKDLCPPDIPLNLTLNGNPVAEGDTAACFANFFYEKVQSNVAKATLDANGVYNGKCHLIVQNRNFMTKLDVMTCMDQLSNKKCEGFDRIPVCALYDARTTLLNPMASLFEKIYNSGYIPEQWKVSKIIPIFKKGSKVEIKNYRPIANLCSTSKIFEKLILKQIHYLERINKIDLTGKNQHGFKRNKSTATAGALLQSIIARAADEKNYVLMASLDLSMAFDVVNTELLVKRLKIMGLPMDLINLIREWLSNRSFYVQVGDDYSALFDSNAGTIQGSVLGPILYALFVSPLFDLTDLVNFADDNFCVEWCKDRTLLIVNLEKKLEMITKWLKDSGLIVNESKTEICMFHQNDQPLVKIKLQNVEIESKKSMNVLGVIFDCKLNWQMHTAMAISKAKKSLYALRLIKRFFNNHEMRTLLDSHFYSTLYYNSVIWLTPSLNNDMKQKLISISANALRDCLRLNNPEISFENLHKIHKKCTPKQITFYQMALKLHKLVNENLDDLNLEQITVMDQMICSRRQINFEIHRNNTGKIGINTTANKLYPLSQLIGLNLLSLGYIHFKKLAKIQFLKNGNT